MRPARSVRSRRRHYTFGIGGPLDSLANTMRARPHYAYWSVRMAERLNVRPAEGRHCAQRRCACMHGQGMRRPGMPRGARCGHTTSRGHAWGRIAQGLAGRGPYEFGFPRTPRSGVGFYRFPHLFRWVVLVAPCSVTAPHGYHPRSRAPPRSRPRLSPHLSALSCRRGKVQ